jgi:hypothetical protein
MHFEKVVAKVVSINLNMFQTTNMHHNVFEAIMKCNITNGAHHAMTTPTLLYFPSKNIRTFK